MNLRQVRKKTKSVANVKKITKAMELVSGIKMKKAQNAEVEGRPYRQTLEGVIDRMVSNIDPQLSLLMSPQKGAKKRTLTVVVSSNKGLCGSFNVNLFRFLVKQTDLKASDYITIGKKGASFLGRSGNQIIADFSSNQPLNEISAVFKLCVEKFLTGEYEKVMLVYTKFISTLKSEPMQTTLLPVSLPEVDKTKKDALEYVVEPAPEQIIDFLLRSFVEEKIRGAVVSSEAVEHSARMIAMKNATENATDLIYEFTLLGNRLRQEKITNELLDMVTAKESVENTQN